MNPVAKGKDAHGNTVKQQSIEGDSRLLTIPGFANVLIVESISRATQGDSSRETQQSADDVMADHIVVPDGTHTNRSNAYFPLDYLPQAIGLKIAMLMNLRPYAQWQAARISNSILYAIMGCIAIALLPRWKSLMALLLVIPPAAFVASSLMIDGMIVALSACMVAAIAVAAEGKRVISLPYTAVLGVLAWALACEKTSLCVCVGRGTVPTFCGNDRTSQAGACGDCGGSDGSVVSSVERAVRQFVGAGGCIT